MFGVVSTVSPVLEKELLVVERRHRAYIEESAFTFVPIFYVKGLEEFRRRFSIQSGEVRPTSWI